MTRLRVLFVTPWYPTREQPVWGIFVREHARALSLYDDVTVIHLREKQDDWTHPCDLQEERDATLTEGVRTFRAWYSRLPLPKGAFPGQLWATLSAVRRLTADGFRPDVIHAHVYLGAAAALPTAKLYRIPLVASEHSTDFPRRALPRFNKWVARWAFGGAALVLPVSRALQESIEQYGVRARFRVVPNAVDLALFHPGSHVSADRAVKKLLFVGLLDALHKKGVPYLLRALADLTAKRADWHLDIVGDGPARAEYERLADELGVANRVTFHGLLPKSRVAEFMRQADVFVLPSVWENLPCVLIEAMASGLPILSTRVGGIPEIVDDAVGRLVAPKDVVGLRDAIDAMLDSLSQFDCRVIVDRARRYSLEVVGKQLADLYRALINK